MHRPMHLALRACCIDSQLQPAPRECTEACAVHDHDLRRTHADCLLRTPQPVARTRVHLQALHRAASGLTTDASARISGKMPMPNGGKGELAVANENRMAQQCVAISLRTNAVQMLPPDCSIHLQRSWIRMNSIADPRHAAGWTLGSLISKRMARRLAKRLARRLARRLVTRIQKPVRNEDQARMRHDIEPWPCIDASRFDRRCPDLMHTPLLEATKQLEFVGA